MCKVEVEGGKCGVHTKCGISDKGNEPPFTVELLVLPLSPAAGRV